MIRYIFIFFAVFIIFFYSSESVEGQNTCLMTAQIQTNLTKLGYNPGPIDGLAGPRTKRALHSFCRDRGIDVMERACFRTALFVDVDGENEFVQRFPKLAQEYRDKAMNEK